MMTSFNPGFVGFRTIGKSIASPIAYATKVITRVMPFYLSKFSVERFAIKLLLNVPYIVTPSFRLILKSYLQGRLQLPCRDSVHPKRSTSLPSDSVVPTDPRRTQSLPSPSADKPDVEVGAVAPLARPRIPTRRNSGPATECERDRLNVNRMRAAPAHARRPPNRRRSLPMRSTTLPESATALEERGPERPQSCEDTRARRNSKDDNGNLRHGSVEGNVTGSSKLPTSSTATKEPPAQQNQDLSSGTPMASARPPQLANVNDSDLLAELVQASRWFGELASTLVARRQPSSSTSTTSVPVDNNLSVPLAGPPPLSPIAEETSGAANNDASSAVASRAMLPVFDQQLTASPESRMGILSDPIPLERNRSPMSNGTANRLLRAPRTDNVALPPLTPEHTSPVIPSEETDFTPAVSAVVRTYRLARQGTIPRGPARQRTRTSSAYATWNGRNDAASDSRLGVSAQGNEEGGNQRLSLTRPPGLPDLPVIPSERFLDTTGPADSLVIRFQQRPELIGSVNLPTIPSERFLNVTNATGSVNIRPQQDATVSGLNFTRIIEQAAAPISFNFTRSSSLDRQERGLVPTSTLGSVRLISNITLFSPPGHAQRYVLLGPLGSGSFGCVALLHSLPSAGPLPTYARAPSGGLYLSPSQAPGFTPTTVKVHAVKIISKEASATHGITLTDMFTEYHVLRSSTSLLASRLSLGFHTFLASLTAAWEDPAFVHLVMPLYASSLASLRDLGPGLPLAHLRVLGAELAVALRCLHEDLHTLHLDLKPENVMLSASGHVRLADFGLSYTGRADEPLRVVKLCGTEDYLAPEARFHDFCEKVGGESEATDMYSLGVLLMVMALGTRYVSSLGCSWSVCLLGERSLTGVVS